MTGISEEHRQHLLSLPYHTLDELRRALDTDPQTLDLIALPGPDGPRFPAFQFDNLRQPRPVVLEVNRILESADDPWGATNWWVGDHASLAGGHPPTLLLGGPQEAKLITLAVQTVSY